MGNTMIANNRFVAIALVAAMGLTACGGSGGGDAEQNVVRNIFAVGEVVETVEDGGAVEGDVSSNDQGDNLSFALASGITMANGTLQFNADGSFVYTPNPDFFGTDAVTYVVTNSATGESDTATLTINVQNDFERLEEYGWNMLWADDFNVDGLDANLWIGINANVVGGNLVVSGQADTSSSVTGINSLRYGRVEASVRAPAGADVFSSFNLVPVADQYDGGNRLSAVDSDAGAVTAGAHYGLGLVSGVIMNAEVVESLSDDFHSYAIEWGANQIRWYIDDAHVHTVDTLHTWGYNQSGSDIVADNQGPFNQDMQVVFELAAAGDDLPAEMIVDYVKVWSCDPTVESGVDECASRVKTKVSRAASDRIEEVGPVTTDLYINGYYDPVTEGKLADLLPLTWHYTDEIIEPAFTYLNEPEMKVVSVDAERGNVLQIINEAGAANIGIAHDGVELIGHNIELRFDLYIDSAVTNAETIKIMMASDAEHMGVISWNMAELELDTWVSYALPVSDFVASPAVVDGVPMPLDIARVTSLITVEVGDSAHFQLDNIQLACVNSEGCVQGPMALQTEAAPKAEPIRYEAENYVSESGTGLENTSDEGGGQNVAFIDQGDYLIYSISAPGIGPYSIDYRVASAGGSAGFEISIDGVLVHTQVVPATGDWQNWTTLTSPLFDLVVGIYSLRIDFLDDGQNLNWFELLPPITEIFIEAEDFDDESGISLEDTNDEGGGQNIGYIDEGDYVEYSITIPSDGNYLIEYRLASAVDSDGFTTSVGGVVVDSQTLLSTGDWQNWITQSSEVPLVAGEQTLRLDFLGGAINVNWIRLTRR